MENFITEIEAKKEEKRKRISNMFQELKTLPNMFNLYRDNNLNIDLIAKKIAELSVEFYQEYYPMVGRETSGIYPLNEILVKELIYSLIKRIKNANKLKTLGETSFYGMVDENNELIFKYELIDFCNYAELDEFMESVIRIGGYSEGIMGFITSNAICYNDKAYILNSNSFSCYDTSIKEKMYGEDYFICRKYGNVGIESINYVYPNKEVINSCEVGYMGNISKFSPYKQELISYSKTVSLEDTIDRYGRPCKTRMIKGEPTLIGSHVLLNWRKIERETRISNQNNQLKRDNKNRRR